MTDIASSAVTTSASRVRPIVETIVALAIVSLMLFILACVGQSFETNWIVVATLPVAFWLLFSGRISTFKAFGLELTAAIRKASSETIKDRDFTLLGSEELTQIVPNPKEAVSQIEDYIRRRTPALSFELERTEYYTEVAIKRYLERLCKHDFFRWVVSRRLDGTFAGLVPAANLKFFSPSPYRALKNMIEAGDVGDLPGFVGPELALHTTDTKGKAIEQFAKTDRDDLPVLDEGRKFVGIINRGRLQSRLLSSILSAAGASP